jgi:hypothetical protein
MSANLASSNARDSKASPLVNTGMKRSSQMSASRRSSFASASSTRSRASSIVVSGDVKSASGAHNHVLLYKDFDDIPLDDVVANVDFLSSERAFNKTSGLLDAVEMELDAGPPFEMLTFATSGVDDNHAVNRAAVAGDEKPKSGGASSHESAEKRLLLHDAAACTLAKSALRRLSKGGGGFHRRLEDPGLKDFRLYLSAGYEKQEQVCRTTYSSLMGPRVPASEGNIFAATSLFSKAPEGSGLGHSSRTLQRSACEVALLHHLSLARRAYALVSKGKFVQAMTVCAHAMRSKSSDAVMSHMLDDALRRGGAAAEPVAGSHGTRDAWTAQLQQAAVEIHTFFVHIMAVASANMGSFLHAIKLYASWIAAIHVDSQWWFSASLSSFHQLTPAHLISMLPLSQRQQVVASAKAVTAIHLMSGQFSNEVMSACLRSSSKQRQHMWQSLPADSMAAFPSLESEMSEWMAFAARKFHYCF